MIDHDHVRAAKSSIYKHLRIEVYETTSYLRLRVAAKPLNECWCTFVPVLDRRIEKETLPGCPATSQEILDWVAEEISSQPPF